MTDVSALLKDAAEGVRVPPLDMGRLRRGARRRRTRRRVTMAATAALVGAVPLTGLLAGGLLQLPDDRLVQPAPPAASSATPEPSAAPTLAVDVFPRLLQAVQLDSSALDGAAPTAIFGQDSVVAGKDIGPGAAYRNFQAVAVAFEKVPLPAADCLQGAFLVMQPAEVTGDGELRAYPSAALSLADGRVPPNGDRPNALLDNRPFGAETVLPDGSLSYDVTEIVRRFGTGALFPSRGRSVPPGSPIVLVLRPPAEDAGTYSRSFDVAASPPVLTTRLKEGCLPG